MVGLDVRFPKRISEVVSSVTQTALGTAFFVLLAPQRTVVELEEEAVSLEDAM